MADSARKSKQRGDPVLRLCGAVRNALESECSRQANEDSLASRAAILDSVVESLRGHFERTVAAFAAVYNARAVSGLAALAPELLTGVFSHLDNRARITASHVCRSWRTSCLTAPLWSTIVSHSQPKGVLDQRISRVPPDAGILLSVWVTEDSWQEVVQALEANMHRIRTLWFRMDDSLSDEAQRAVRKAFVHPAPLLEGLRILDGKSNLKMAEQPMVPFVGILPRLQQIKYYGQLDILIAFPDTIQRVMFSLPGTTTIDHFATLAAHLQTPVSISIELDGWQTPPDNTAKVSFSPGLQTLFLGQNDRSFAMAEVVAHIEHRSIPNFGINYREGNGEDAAMRVFEHLVTSTLSNPLGDTFAVHVDRLDVRNLAKMDGEYEVFLSDGRRRFFSDCPMKWPSAHACLDLLTHLRISESALAQVLVSDGPYDLGNVVQLDIVLTPLHFQSRDIMADNSLFLLPRRTKCWLLGSNLQTLVFHASYAQLGPSTKDARTLSRSNGLANLSHTFALGPDMLREFLGWHLDCNLRNLKVVLRDIELVAHDGANVARLLSEVGELVVEEIRQDEIEHVSPFNELQGWDSDSRFPFLDQLG